MPFNPHTEAEIAAMLATVGVSSIEDLFDEIPDSLRMSSLDEVPEALSEMEVARLTRARAAQDGTMLNFIGAGAYEHDVNETLRLPLRHSAL